MPDFSISVQTFTHLTVGWATWININRGHVIMFPLFPLDTSYVQKFFRGSFHSFDRRSITGTASAAFTFSV